MIEVDCNDEPSVAQISTLLAALRYYQRGLENKSIPIQFMNIATNDGLEEPLTIEEIDELCERVNG